MKTASERKLFSFWNIDLWAGGLLAIERVKSKNEFLLFRASAARKKFEKSILFKLSYRCDALKNEKTPEKGFSHFCLCIICKPEAYQRRRVNEMKVHFHFWAEEAGKNLRFLPRLTRSGVKIHFHSVRATTNEKIFWNLFSENLIDTMW